MTDMTITAERIDELTRFLPLFEANPPWFVVDAVSSETGRETTQVLRHPVYARYVEDFFWLAGQPWWSDYDYVPRQAAVMLADDALIERAGLAEIKTMLTYCVRGERFGDGHWASVLESGRVVALLRRLQALRPAFDGSASEAGAT